MRKPQKDFIPLIRWAKNLTPPMWPSNARKIVQEIPGAYQPNGPGTMWMVPKNTKDPRRWTHK